MASDNQITNIDVLGLCKLRRLAILDFSNNNIAHVPPELGNLIHLRYFYMVLKQENYLALHIDLFHSFIIYIYYRFFFFNFILDILVIYI